MDEDRSRRGMEALPGEGDTEDPASSPGKGSDMPRVDLLQMGLLVEGGLVILAVVIGGLGFCDPHQSLMDLGWQTVLFPALSWGILGTLPMLLLLWALLKSEWRICRRMRETVDEKLVPLFGDCSLSELAILSCMAGLGEELFFRWCLQGGVTDWWGGAAGPWIGMVVVGVIFGFCHFINLNYAFWISWVGIYLGGLMVLSGTYLAPVISHAAYDFIALWILAGRQKRALCRDSAPESQ
ncbi:MAG: CPBP family intramembrane glutamic endopeptidase [Planctomycetota bacterium]|nr:CPBP family intramembrane glutamic endopeptidase [Planctomycetota bacterium]